jgi:hypothetical protein
MTFMEKRNETRKHMVRKANKTGFRILRPRKQCGSCGKMLKDGHINYQQLDVQQ